MDSKSKDNPADSQGVFHLVNGKQLIGELTYSNGVWDFEYSSDFKRNSFAQPIMDFPDKEKKYTNEQLWPFFATRIPSLNQRRAGTRSKKTQIVY